MVTTVSESTRLWEKALLKINEKLDDKKTYDEFFADSYIYDINGDVITIVTRSKVAKVLLVGQYFNLITSVVNDLTNDTYKLNYLSPEDLSRVSITEKSSISVLVKEINRIIPSNMKPLSYSTVTNWLIKHGYLDVIVTEDGRKTKVPTDLGKSLGISTEQRFGSNGEYTAVIYNANAQRFILDNLLQV